VFKTPQQFGLLEAPFAAQPDERFLFNSSAHSGALERIVYGIDRGEAVIVVTGEAGTGKTLLCGEVRRRLCHRHVLSIVADHQSSDAAFLQQTIPSPAAAGQGAVVIVDAAEEAPLAFLQQLGPRASAGLSESQRLQFVLVGRPSLDRRLDAPELRQLRPLISTRHELGPLTSDEVQPYLERRLWVAHGGPVAAAGSNGSQFFWRVRFTAGGIRTTTRLSSGIPLTINALSDRALESCVERRDTRVDASDVVSAARQMAIPVPLAAMLESRNRLVAAAVLILTLAAGLTASRAVSTPASLAGIFASSPTAGAPLGHMAKANTGATAGTTTSSAPAGSAQTAVSTLAEIESFTVVAASFRSPSRAAAFAARLTDSGLPAFTQPMAGDWHQVIVGPYASREEAQGAQRQLAKVQVTATRIVATAPSPDSRQEG